jgi:hypothetical protein
MRLKFNALAILTMLMLAGSMAAQGPPDPISVSAGGGAMLAQKGGMISMRVADMETAPVKGAPFCATVTTEHTQPFADGNRIHTTENSTLCRDSEGRTRREATLNLMGAAPQKPASKLITIVDPVAGVRYLLDTENKIAHKATLPPVPPNAPSGGDVAFPDKGQRVVLYQTAAGAGPAGPVGPAMLNSTEVFFKRSLQDANEPAPTTENLGEQTINGIAATGTRMTTTIPSGKVGNDKPITVTSERWYASDLKVAVMTKHDDPWAGELKTEFTSVNTSEPDASLFTVPSDYKVVDDKNGPVKIQMMAPAPPAP